MRDRGKIEGNEVRYGQCHTVYVVADFLSHFHFDYRHLLEHSTWKTKKPLIGKRLAFL
jgi:hypothetical protein